MSCFPARRKRTSSFANAAKRRFRPPRREAIVSRWQSVGARDRTRPPPPRGSRFPVGPSRARASPPSPRTSRAVAPRDPVAAKSSFAHDSPSPLPSQPRDARAWSRPRAAMTVAAEGATKVAKPEPASMPGVPAAANGAAPGAGDLPAANPADYAQWAAAAAMQSYYAGANAKAPAGAPNGQQAAAYYAQMAQQPNLYAQMWANPVRSAPHPAPLAPSRASPSEQHFSHRGVVRANFRTGVTTSPAERPPRGVFRPDFSFETVSRFSADFGFRHVCFVLKGFFLVSAAAADERRLTAPHTSRPNPRAGGDRRGSRARFPKRGELPVPADPLRGGGAVVFRRGGGPLLRRRRRRGRQGAALRRVGRAAGRARAQAAET